MMRAASAEGEVNLFVGIVPIEGIFHFVTVAPLVTVGLKWFDGDVFWEGDVSLSERFGDEGALLGEFVIPI